MAYTPIGNKVKSGGYVPIGNKAQPKETPAPAVNLPLPSLTTQGSTPQQTNQTTLGAVKDAGKQAGKIVTAVVQGTGRAAVATGAYPTARLMGATPEQARSVSVKPPTDPLSKFALGTEPISLQSEGVEPLKGLGASEKTANVLAAPFVIGSTLLDAFTGGGKKAALVKSLKAVENTNDARKILKAAGVPEDVIFGLKLDGKAVAAKTDVDVEKLLKEIVPKVAPLPKLPKAPAPASTKVDNVAAPIRGLPEAAPAPVAKVAPDIIEEAKKYKSAEEFVKAQAASRYHGTSRAIDGVKTGDEMYSSQNIYGQGFYTTDNLDIAEGYTKKGRGGSPSVYKIKEKSEVPLWDIEAKTPNNLLNKVNGLADSLGISSWPKGTPLREIYDELRGLSQAGEFSADEIQDIFDGIRVNIEEAGYRGIKHVGGKLTGKDPHNVNIYWYPEKDLDLVPAETRTQLTDIWNQAQKTAPSTDLKPDLPPLPKLPPEMAQRLRVQQADETISRAVFDRYKNIANKPPVVDSKVVAEAKKAPGAQTQKFFGELLTPISSRLRRINPDLEVQLRKMEFEVNQNTAKSMEAIKPLLEGSAKMSPVDRKLFSLARLNGDREVYEALAEKYGLTNQLKAAESALEDIRVRANQVGMDIAKRDNYSPRIIKNPKAYLNYWRGQDDWGDINRLIEEEAKKKNIKYEDLEKDSEKVAAIINNYIRGYGSKTVLAAPSATKKRTIAVLDEELSEFYEDADTALATYMIRMNDEIVGRKFFGKRGDGDADIQNSIGAHVMELVSQGKIKKEQQEEVADILRSRFHRGKIAGALDLYRNAEYISTMGSPISAITQIGDFAWSLYDNGFWNTGKAVVGKKKLTREALGLDASIMNEYTNGTLGGKAVEKTFKLVGLDKMARLGQESMVNAQFARYQKMARENDDVLRAEMDRLFDSDEAAQAIKEFANGDITERTKFVVFNRLLDFQPLTKSEMPQVYLERPNGRIFYMLKSFTLKQYDVFRREAFDKIATGEAAQVKQGVKNLIALAGLFVMANATADEIKDLVLGRETPPSDRLVDNLWRLVGASKYDVYKAREEGIGTTVLRKILFPASIWDRASKDFETIVTDKEYEKGPMAGENYKFESTQTIPVAGKLYYWWFGRGAQKEEYKESTQKETETTPTSTLPELPKLPKLPKI